jgi:hypothetical protein
VLFLTSVQVLVAACEKMQSIEGSQCQRITPWRLQLAVQVNEQLDTLVRTTVAGGGALALIQKSLTAGKLGAKKPDALA